MKLKLLLIVLALGTCLTGYSQAIVSKLIGKNGSSHKIGFGLFANYEFLLGDAGDRSIMLEVVDGEYFPGKPYDVQNNSITRSFVSVKLGYKKIFSEESRTGPYIEPQLGWVKVLVEDDQWGGEVKNKNGISAALETGYSLEVGKGGNAFIFGLKYENAMAGKDFNIQSVAFKVGFSFFTSTRNR